MPHYTTSYNWRIMHWACIECLVRPMCNQRCNRTYYKHYLCESCKSSNDCNDCNDYPCKEVEKLQMYERVFHAYGHVMMKYLDKQIKESSMFRLMKPSKPMEKWWTTI